MERVYYRGYRITRNSPDAMLYNVEQRITVSWTGATRYIWIWSYESLEAAKTAIDYHLGVQ